ncbi:MAG: beta-N-acetylhexosaminidase [Rhodocyclaceae bacterium]|nr:beta-N-acetylhexosaminidase [Rhodocyclaceae bacterium]
MTALALGPLFIDIAGPELADIDRQRLSHPLIGGLILFSRNYRDRAQLAALCAEVHALRTPPLPITIDHEGGRVQRCREGFTALPPMRRLGELWQRDQATALDTARLTGYLLAAELRACGVDFSFTPVLDLDYGRSRVIGDRAFHSDPAAVSRLAGALIEGLRQAGMGACGKHFPGHGWVEADSHVAIPVDDRDEAAIVRDMAPFGALDLDAMMPAHVIYPKVDSRPAGFSPLWIGKLRRELSFDGVIFSDDLSMEGAAVAGGIVERVNAAWSAGCDALLVCNAPESVATLLDQWRPEADPLRAARKERLLPQRCALSWTELEDDARYRAAQQAIAQLRAGPTGSAAGTPDG